MYRWRFLVFLQKKLKRIDMTISEACERVLKDLGGRAHLSEIYPRVLKLVTLTGATPKNSIRTEMKNHPLLFRHSPNKPRGWWELTSYQEELATLKKENAELKEENKQLRAIPKEADFVESFLREVMNEYKRKRGEADPIRNILRHMRHEEAAAVLDAWIDEREDELKKALKKLAEMALKPINVQGDYVVDKQVGNEVIGVASGGTGINISKEEE